MKRGLFVVPADWEVRFPDFNAKAQRRNAAKNPKSSQEKTWLAMQLCFGYNPASSTEQREKR
jgi:hypothetical protein